MTSGGTLKRRLDQLEASSLIERSVPYGKANKGHYLKVVDEYSLFYLTWIEPFKSSRAMSRGRNYWANCAKSPAFLSWRGYAFEAVCAKHVDAIIRALGLESTALTASGWRAGAKAKTRGAQIDLLIDRADDAMTLCEMRYAQAPYRLDRRTIRELTERLEAFEAATGTREQLLWALVTPHGLQPGLWSDDGEISSVALLDAFR